MRMLKVYDRHTQANAIDFFKHIQKKFPFKVAMIRTDNGHEFQAQFHWTVLDQGIKHVYIKKRTPRLNRKVERSHRTDKDEFYFHLSYKNDKDLVKKSKSGKSFIIYIAPMVLSVVKHPLKKSDKK